jgi:hypothetical protein
MDEVLLRNPRHNSRDIAGWPNRVIILFTPVRNEVDLSARRNPTDVHTVALPRGQLPHAAVRLGCAVSGYVPNTVEFTPHPRQGNDDEGWAGSAALMAWASAQIALLAAWEEPHEQAASSTEGESAPGTLGITWEPRTWLSGRRDSCCAPRHDFRTVSTRLWPFGSNPDSRTMAGRCGL